MSNQATAFVPLTSAIGVLSRVSRAFVLGAAGLLGACASVAEREPIPLVGAVDLDRFMGDWYVIAHIPTWPERKAYNAIESYQRGEGERIVTRYRQRSGSFDAEVQWFHPTGFVRPGHAGALWGMQFVWPIKAEYRIVGLAEDYSWTVVGRNQRDYAWIMARTPEMDPALYASLVAQLAAWGYDLSALRQVPQRWPEPVSPE